LLGYSKIKNGPNHNDFSGDEPIYVSPSDNIKYKNNIVVLVDKGTYSAGSITSLFTKAITNIILIGDTTGGGLGMPNGGQLPNGWTYRLSITQTLDLNKDNSFENGVPPDIRVLFDWNNLIQDEVIERAILEIL
jgi:C-terminal processing protease CtpA/Prc